MKLMNLHFQGELIDLRLITTEDKPQYFDIGFKDVDEEINYYTGTKTAFTQEQVFNYIDRIVNDDTRYDFLILDKSGNILGEVVLNEIEEESRRANFRICVFKSSLCEKGYGSEAIKLILQFAFETLYLHRVELEVFSFNSRAQKVYSNAGFIREGIKRDGDYINGKYCDVIMMSMLESDYRAKH